MDRKTNVAAGCWNSVSYVGHQKVSFQTTMERNIHIKCGHYQSITGIFLAPFNLITVKNILNV
jgi:hypothetical protein